MLRMSFTKKQILEQLDQGFNGIPGPEFPNGRSQDIKYNFFLDLEHGYCETAGSKIHLYSDVTRWAIVFEKTGYFNRATRAEIELNYFGNCITYPVDEYPERNYISNSCSIVLIDNDEFERIENKERTDMETFELISKDIVSVKVRDTLIPFNSNYKDYEKLGIVIRDYGNPGKLIAFEDFVRYLNETDPVSIDAREEDIGQHIPQDLPKIMTIDQFHFVSAYDKNNPPSGQETYQMIADILVSGDIKQWKPTQAANNHWANWESGNL